MTELPSNKPPRPVVRRPPLLAATLALALGAFGLAGYGVWTQHDARMAPTPELLADPAEAIAEALADSPWLGADAAESGALWVLAPVGCDGCPAFHRETVAALARRMRGVRVLVYPVAGAQQKDIEWTAAVAQSRRFADYQSFTAPAAGVPVSADAAETEGFAGWARASAERLADLGVRTEAPAVLWRTPEGWRLLAGAAAFDVARVQQAAAPAAPPPGS